MRRVILFILTLGMLTNGYSALGQTPGMIVKPATGAGQAVLDPDGDGYVSQKTNGVQIGFTIPPQDDIVQSEIPFVPIVRPDPLSDLLRGPSGFFGDIVGVDETGKNAIMIYNDGVNLLFRFRLGGYAPNSKSYSVLIDTDQKFGFTGLNADPNAVSGNPGFEVEVVLRTNFSVDVYNVDGAAQSTDGNRVATYSYDTNCQKSLTVSNASGDPDYFYDFYVPFSAISSLGITTSTPLRFVSLTTMNPNPAIGNNAASDFGGVTTGRNIDDIFGQLIAGQTPTSIDNINNEGILERSDCPTLSSVVKSAANITGTTTETSGIITVYVYNDAGTILLGKASTAITGGGWTLSVSSLSPAVTLAEGQIVKATATGTGRGESYDNCDIEIVSATCSPAISSGVANSNANKGVAITVDAAYAIGSIVTLYRPDGSLFPNSQLATTGGSAGDSNPAQVKSGDYFIEFKCQTGNCFGNELYLITIQQPGECESDYFYYCGYATGGTSATPAITTNPITPTTTTISGTGTSPYSVIKVYIDGAYLGTTSSSGTETAPGSGLYAWNYAVSGLKEGQSITVKQVIANQCISDASVAVLVSRKATRPGILTSGCSTTPPTTIEGYSTEIGATVTLYRTAPTTGTLGTATVDADGEWTIEGLTLSVGDVLVAKVTSGTYLRESDASESITITSQTPDSRIPTIVTTTIYEGDTEITGTGQNGDIITLYVDGSTVFDSDGDVITTTVSGGNWTITGLSAYDLYIGGVVHVTATQAGYCEGNASSTKVVQCVPPTVAEYSGGEYNYCYANSGQISILSSQAGVIYQLVNGSGTAVGPSILGTGSGITLHTFPLTDNMVDVYVKAYKIGYNTCSATSTNEIKFFIKLPTPTITLSSTALSVSKGTTSVNLPYSAKSVKIIDDDDPTADHYTIAYSVAAKAQGFADITTKTALAVGPNNIPITVPSAAVTGTYNATLTVHTDDLVANCTRSYAFTISIYDPDGPPVISVQPVNVTICTGNTASLTAAAVGAGTIGYQWQISDSFSGTYANVSTGSGGTTDSYTTATLSATKYFRVVVSNENGSVTSNIATVYVNPKPVAGTISGSATVCDGTTVTYSISPISNATSYTWQYTGTGATLTPSTNSVSVQYLSEATGGDIKVRGNNACGFGEFVIKAVTVNPTPFINNMTGIGCNAASFSITPADGVNGIVPASTTYSWGVPSVTGGLTGGASGSGSSISGTLTNPTTTTQTATYTVTPSRASCVGSTFTLSVNVNPPINISATPNDALCYEGTTGSVDVVVTGGTPGYTYAWTGPNSFTSTAQNLSGREAGTYNLTVTDSKGCTKTAAPVVGQATDIAIIPTPTHVSCNGGSNGEISLSVSGGAGSYTYLWNDGNASQNRTGLVAGIYTVNVTDANGCVKGSGNITVTQPTAISASAAVTTPINCFGGTATITVTASGGTGALQYSLNGGAYQSSNQFAGVAASTSQYIITVKDEKDCTVNTSVTISQPAALVLSAALTHTTCPNSTNGAVALTVTGGTTPYAFAWVPSGGGTIPAGQEDDEDLNGLTPGTYTVTVTDAKGCTKSLEVTVTALNPNPVQPTEITK
jgi:hypothetical protein